MNWIKGLLLLSWFSMHQGSSCPEAALEKFADSSLSRYTLVYSTDSGRAALLETALLGWAIERDFAVPRPAEFQRLLKASQADPELLRELQIALQREYEGLANMMRLPNIEEAFKRRVSRLSDIRVSMALLEQTAIQTNVAPHRRKQFEQDHLRLCLRYLRESASEVTFSRQSRALFRDLTNRGVPVEAIRRELYYRR